MSDCNAYIEKIYIHPDINLLISKIKPESIRDDLRQEVAVSLLEMPCEKVAALFSGDNLVRYAIKICWIMATSKTSTFYNKFRRNDCMKAIEYLKTLQPLPTIPVNFATKAEQYLSKNNHDIYSDHETRVFNKYIELGSCRQVALFYGIPINHTCNIVAKMKRELKSILIN